jgi:hypothetical protein
MSTTRSRKPADEAAKNQPDAVEGPARIPAHVWVAGDGSKQVPLAGLLVDDPTLRDAELTHEEWDARLDEYLRSERS